MGDILKNQKIPTWTLLRRTLKYIAKEKKSFIFAFLLVIFNAFVGVLTPRISGFFTDYITGNELNLTYILLIASLVFGVALVSQVFVYIETMILTKAGQRIVYSLRMETFSHIESMSQNQFNDMAVGSLVTRVCSYTSQLSEFFTNILVKIAKDLLTVLITFIWMLVLSPTLGGIMSGVMIIIFVISYFFSKYIHVVFTKERNQLSDLNAFLNESLSGMKIIQLFRQEEKYLKAFNKKNHEFFKTKYLVTVGFMIYRPLISLIYVLSIALILYSGISLRLTAGTIVSFYLFLNYFFEPVQSLADALNNINRATSSIEKLFNLFDIKPEVVDKEDAIDIDHFEGKIEFKHVYFAYEKDNWILKDVSFVVNPKETIAFIGATGAGKTTILNLIVKNFEIQSGQILIDDIDINNIKISSLRRNIGQMLQDVYLFSGTIKENITLFDNSYSEQEISSAVKYVNADTFIDNLDDGVETKIVERGDNFSIGQKQLLSFARTIIHKPQIMILDEATANIDAETESVIQDSLNNIKSVGTMLIVAHRLSTIQNADKIIVLSHGEIIESGNHQELLDKQGYYYNLYNLQFK